MLNKNIRAYPIQSPLSVRSTTLPVPLINNFVQTTYPENANPTNARATSQPREENTKKPPISPHSKLSRSPKISNLAHAGLFLFHPNDPRISPQQPTYDHQSNLNFSKQKRD